jgi:predicted kinase
MLVTFSGLPGVGKTTIARELARVTGAVHLRIDSIEQALKNVGLKVATEGYLIAYAVAEDNLRAGRVVIADCVNPVPATRNAWRSLAIQSGGQALEIEIVCSDGREHQRRVESRVADIPDHPVPTWFEVLQHDYQPWTNPRLVVDTARASLAQCVEAIASAMRANACLGKRISIQIDRPLGSSHPEHGFRYPVNYGFVPETLGGDGEALDAYVLEVTEPLKTFEGECIAIVRRRKERDDKLVIVPSGLSLSEKEVRRALDFQEQFFESDFIFVS